MRLFSKVEGGFKSGGGMLVRKGENTLIEPLTPMERDFVACLIKGRLAEILPEETHEISPPPASETKLVGTSSSRLDDAPPAMKIRRRRRVLT